MSIPPKLPKVRFFFLLLVSVVLIATYDGQAQQNDEQRRLLEVRRRQLELQSVRRQYDRTAKLAAAGLVPRSELDRDASAVDTAQLNYQQSVLALLDLQPRMSVKSATLSQTADGRKFVRIVIVNLTPTFDDSQFKLLNNFEGADPIPEQLRMRTVNDIFVSLRDAGSSSGGNGGSASSVANATISLPYEIHIPQLKYGESKRLDYQLLRDVDSVVVAMSYRNQTQEVPLQLQRAEGGNEIRITSSQSSQEADLNSQATYSLTLERPTVDVRSFQLKVVNLPRQIAYSFIDPQSQARLSQVNFPAGQTRQSLGLRLSLPERSDNEVPMDKPLEFWALTLDDAAATRFDQQRIYSPQEIAAAGTGSVKLLIIPRGVGKIEVTAPSLFSEIETGQTVITKFTVRNTGTRRLDNVKLWAEYPLNWRAQVEPNIIPSLDINQEEIVTLTVSPPSDVSVGDYELRLKTESFADNKRVQTEDKTYRVSIKAKTNLMQIGAVSATLLLFVAGMIAFVVKLTRR
jgi:alpha-galactosidase-like protein